MSSQHSTGVKWEWLQDNFTWPGFWPNFPDSLKLEQLPLGSLAGSLPRGNPAVPKPPLPGLAAGLDGGSSLHVSPFCVSQVGVGVKPLLHPSDTLTVSVPGINTQHSLSYRVDERMRKAIFLLPQVLSQSASRSPGEQCSLSAWCYFLQSTHSDQWQILIKNSGRMQLIYCKSPKCQLKKPF